MNVFRALNATDYRLCPNNKFYNILYITVPTELSDAAVSSKDVCGMSMTSELEEGGWEINSQDLFPGII